MQTTGSQTTGLEIPDLRALHNREKAILGQQNSILYLSLRGYDYMHVERSTPIFLESLPFSWGAFPLGVHMPIVVCVCV